jgi:hypothetical protein
MRAAQIQKRSLSEFGAAIDKSQRPPLLSFNFSRERERERVRRANKSQTFHAGTISSLSLVDGQKSAENFQESHENQIRESAATTCSSAIDRKGKSDLLERSRSRARRNFFSHDRAR